MKLRGVLAGFGVVILAGCSGQAASQPSTTQSAAAGSAISSAASSSAKLTTAAATTAASAVLSDLCDRHCDALNEVYNLPPCSVGTDCVAQVKQADAAIDALRKDMADNDISRETFLDLDDALTSATSEIDDYNLFGCVDEVKGSQDMFTCAIDALTVKTSVGSVAITLGSMQR